MKTLIIYHSMFGNTEKVARAIADALSKHTQTEIAPVEEADIGRLQEGDLLLLGCPTQALTMTLPVKSLLNSIPPDALKGCFGAAFDTRLPLKGIMARFVAAPGIANKLKKAGVSLVMPPEGFIVTGKEGPLAEGELARATLWAEQVFRQVEFLQTLHKEKAPLR